MRSTKSFLLIISIVAVLLSAAFAPQAYRILAAFNASDDSFVRNGKDIIWYSGNLTGETVRIDGAAGDATFAGNVTATGVISSGSLTYDELTVTGNVTGTDLISVDDVLAGDDVAATGDVSGVNITASNLITGLDVTAGDDVAATDDVTAGGDVLATGDVAGTAGTFTGNVSVGLDLRLFPVTAITVTDGTTITPVGAYQPLIGSGTITAATISASSASAGDLVVLINTTNTTINIADSSTTMLSSAAALGQYDTLTLFFDGGNWLELARSNN